MQTTQHTVTTKSGEKAEVAITAATTDAGERMFLVRVISGPVSSLTDITAWEATAPRTGPVKIDTEAQKVAVDHISQIVAPMEDVAPPDETVR